MWGIIPAAGNGTRIQPLAFSKELLPVGSRLDETGVERPRAVGEHILERMVRAGVDKICLVVSPCKTDIVRYFGGSLGTATLAYVVQNQADGLCDAIFNAVPLIPVDEDVVIGLPDTIWFPTDALDALPARRFSFLLFPVERPELFDAVDLASDDKVRRILVKSREAVGGKGWIWGAFKMPGRDLHALHALWIRRDRRDEYIGSLVNAWIEQGGEAWGVRAGQRYVDVGTLHGYREAVQLLGDSEIASGGRIGHDALDGDRPDRLP